MIKFFGSSADCYNYVLKCPLKCFSVFGFAIAPEIFIPYPSSMQDFFDMLCTHHWQLFAVVSGEDEGSFYNSLYWDEIASFVKGRLDV